MTGIGFGLPGRRAAVAAQEIRSRNREEAERQLEAFRRIGGLTLDDFDEQEVAPSPSVGSIVQLTTVETVDVGDGDARAHVEGPAEEHDLHRLADDGCPHHDKNEELYQKLVAAGENDALFVPRVGTKNSRGEERLAAAGIPVRHTSDAIVPERGAGALPIDPAERKGIPLATGVLDYFPDALAAVAEVSRIGNEQHNPGQPLHWAKGKSTDHADCAVRHLVDRGTRDTDGGRHTAKAAWRVLALLQMEIEAERAGLPFNAYIAKLKEAA